MFRKKKKIEIIRLKKVNQPKSIAGYDMSFTYEFVGADGVFVNRIFSQKTIENSVTFFFDMAPVHFRCHMFYFAISSKLVPFSFNVSLNR